MSSTEHGRDGAASVHDQRVHNLLPELRQGLFAQPVERPVIIRFSTAPGDRHRLNARPRHEPDSIDRLPR